MTGDLAQLCRLSGFRRRLSQGPFPLLCRPCPLDAGILNGEPGLSDLISARPGRPVRRSSAAPFSTGRWSPIFGGQPASSSYRLSSFLSEAEPAETSLPTCQQPGCPRLITCTWTGLQGPSHPIRDARMLWRASGLTPRQRHLVPWDNRASVCSSWAVFPLDKAGSFSFLSLFHLPLANLLFREMKKGQTSRPGQLKYSPFRFSIKSAPLLSQTGPRKKRRLFLEKATF